MLVCVMGFQGTDSRLLWHHPTHIHLFVLGTPYPVHFLDFYIALLLLFQSPASPFPLVQARYRSTSCGYSHIVKEVWLARDWSAFPWSPITTGKLQTQLVPSVLGCLPTVCPCDGATGLGPHLPAGLISSVALNPIFYLPGFLLIPACRCLGFW